MSTKAVLGPRPRKGTLALCCFVHLFAEVGGRPRVSVLCLFAGYFMQLTVLFYRLILKRFSYTAVTLLMLATSASISAEEFTRITIPLREGRFYSPREFCRECNRLLKTNYAPEMVAGGERELSPLDRAALLLADNAGLIRVRLDDRRLEIDIVDTQDPKVRDENRRRLERLFRISIPAWPPEKGLRLPQHLDQDARTVLLIHGLRSNGTDLTRFREACKHSGIQVLTFDYPNNGPLERAGKRLGEELRRLAITHPRLRLVVVAHSMGGLVMRHCLECTDTPPSCVTDVFMLGTPHAGSALADYCRWLDLMQVSWPWPQAGLLQEGLGEAGEDLKPGSRFLAGLDARRRPNGVRYHTGAGCKSFLSESERSAIESEVNAILTRRNAPLEVQRSLKALLKGDEIREQQGDGLVSVTSATLPVADTRQKFNLNHLELIHLPAVRPEDSEVFRWIISTLGWEKEAEIR
ncbi:MAG: putative lipase [Planctomycetes bacterium]|nr:putative lipase [Planctomycetota bacterium]